MTSKIARAAVALAALFAPAVAGAQALQCSVPATIPRPHPEDPTPREPQRLLPIGSYTLAVTWVPEFCHGKQGATRDSFECGGSKFGFALHGLWPDGIGKEWPQYCKSTALLPPAVLQQNMCATPSAQLMQHEWSKHGTCMARDPASYFAQSTGLYAKLRYPDMNALSRDRSLTVGAFAQAFADANPGMRPEMIRVTVNRSGWLDELWLCLDKAFAFTRCKAGTGGEAPGAALKIWRGQEGPAGGYGSGYRPRYRSKY